jgi:hypothetical protein
MIHPPALICLIKCTKRRVYLPFLRIVFDRRSGFLNVPLRSLCLISVLYYLHVQTPPFQIIKAGLLFDCQLHTPSYSTITQRVAHLIPLLLYTVGANMNEILLKSKNLYFNRRPVSEFSDWQKKKRACVVRATSPLTKVDDDGKPWENCYPSTFPTIHIISINRYFYPSLNRLSINHFSWTHSLFSVLFFVFPRWVKSPMH